MEPGWLPIESAPKGEHVLLFYPSIMLRGCGYGEDVTVGWLVDGKWDVFSKYSPIEPTHWMPLPAAPVADTSQKEKGNG